MFPFVSELSLSGIIFYVHVCLCAQKNTSRYFTHVECCFYPQKKPAVSKSINCVSVYASIPGAGIFLFK